MKKLWQNYSYLIVLIVLATFGTIALKYEFANQPEAVKEVQPEFPYSDEYAFFTYKISAVRDGGYYGENFELETYPGIYFDQRVIQSGETFKKGDMVTAIFDKDDLAEGLVDVIKAEGY